jgi:hypothetical protein
MNESTKTFTLILNAVHHEVKSAVIDSTSPFTILPGYAKIMGIGTLVSYVPFDKKNNLHDSEDKKTVVNQHGAFYFKENTLHFVV